MKMRKQRCMGLVLVLLSLLVVKMASTGTTPGGQRRNRRRAAGPAGYLYDGHKAIYPLRRRGGKLRAQHGRRTERSQTMARKRITETPAIKNWEEVDAALREIAEAELALGDIEAELNRQIIGAKKVAEQESKPYADRSSKLERDVKEFVTDHRDELGKAKSRSLQLRRGGLPPLYDDLRAEGKGEGRRDRPPSQGKTDDGLHYRQGEDQQGCSPQIRRGHGQRRRRYMETEGHLRLRGIQGQG